VQCKLYLVGVSSLDTWLDLAISIKYRCIVLSTRKLGGGGGGGVAVAVAVAVVVVVMNTTTTMQ
jgi:hypothetical protein